MIKCSVIQDLLPLYVDHIASEESCELVEEHLEICADCNEALKEMKSCVSLKLPDVKVDNALKKVKKKLFHKNVIVAAFSVAAVIAALICLWSFVLTPLTPIMYEEGILSAEINVVKYVDDGGAIVVITDGAAASGEALESEVVDIVSSKKTAQINSSSIHVEENGENVELIFINFTENLLSKWEPGGEMKYAFRAVEPHLNYYYQESGQKVFSAPVDRTEIYYVEEMIKEINISKDYDALRKKGHLVWSGSLK